VLKFYGMESTFQTAKVIVDFIVKFWTKFLHNMHFNACVCGFSFIYVYEISKFEA